MKVCYVTNGLKMGHYHYAQNLLRGFRDIEGLSVDAWFIDIGEGAEFPGAERVCPLATDTRATRPRNVLVTLWYHLRFVAYLLCSRPDVVHFNTVFRNQYHTLGLTLLANAAGARVVRTVHEITAERLTDVSETERRAAYLQLRACDRLIVHSTVVRQRLRANDVSTAVTVLPHGNYLCFREHLDPAVAPPLPAGDGPTVLFFGPKLHKGIDVFRDALTRVETSFTTWVVGPVRADAEAAVDAIGATPNAHVDTGYVPDERLPDYFHHADIVVLPYHQGTTSGAVHLARAFETAVVTSPLPCFTDVVEHGVDGYVLSENTPSALAAALDELVGDPELTGALAAAGLETERSPRFDWGRIARRTVDSYEA